MSVIVSKILERIGLPDLVKQLSENLSGTELNSLLLEVLNQRTSGVTPAALLKHYQVNRFVKPADLPVIEMKRMELDLLLLFQKFSFQPIELSPVTVLGACSVVAPADQNKILSALRGTEVVADATNSIALHISHLKKTGQWEPATRDDKLRIATILRHIRTQSLPEGKGFTPHFKIGCLVTSGVDTGNFMFEKESLGEHIVAMSSLFKNYFKAEEVSFRFLCRAGYEHPQEFARQVRDFIISSQKDVVIYVTDHPEKEIFYYKGIQYKIDIVVKGKTYEIGDGGFVDWTQQLLQNKKERMLTTGIGFDFMYRILQGEI
jgi:hypothetical protein